MDTKTCCICKKNLLKSEFKSNKAKKDGLQCQCMSCQKQYRRQHYLDNRQKYINKAGRWKKSFLNWWREYKARFKCVNCGESHPACIHFHHKDDNKEKSVAEFVSDGCKASILKEIAKCVPLCANCHAKEHWRISYSGNTQDFQS